jgi:hypothetical protein
MLKLPSMSTQVGSSKQEKLNERDARFVIEGDGEVNQEIPAQTTRLKAVLGP